MPTSTVSPAQLLMGCWLKGKPTTSSWGNYPRTQAAETQSEDTKTLPWQPNWSMWRKSSGYKKKGTQLWSCTNTSNCDLLCPHTRCETVQEKRKVSTERKNRWEKLSIYKWTRDIGVEILTQEWESPQLTSIWTHTKMTHLNHASSKQVSH